MKQKKKRLVFFWVGNGFSPIPSAWLQHMYLSGDVSEPTGNYHNKNSIHKLMALPNFLLPFASKSH